MLPSKPWWAMAQPKTLIKTLGVFRKKCDFTNENWDLTNKQWDFTNENDDLTENNWDLTMIELSKMGTGWCQWVGFRENLHRKQWFLPNYRDFGFDQVWELGMGQDRRVCICLYIYSYLLKNKNITTMFFSAETSSHTHLEFLSASTWKLAHYLGVHTQLQVLWGHKPALNAL